VGYTGRPRPRLALYGLLAGAMLGFGVGCYRAATNNARAAERLRAQDPNAHVCGLVMFAEVAAGLVCAVPGGLLGAAVGAVCRHRRPAEPDADRV
jgi:hypothetical protein